MPDLVYLVAVIVGAWLLGLMFMQATSGRYHFGLAAGAQALVAAVAVAWGLLGLGVI